MPPIRPKKEDVSAPHIRLSVTNDGMPSKESRYPHALGPHVRLAHVPGAQGDNNLLGQRGVEQLPAESQPALLVSYVYLKPFLENKERYSFRDWVMDSGAFSAHSLGIEIKHQDYLDCCKKLLSEDKSLSEVFALDVIGDWKASLANVEEAWRQGVEAIPCFHYGEPWDLLKGLAKDYPKIAIGGCVGRRDKDKFAGQCFARVWPKKLHGFGFGSETSIMLYPWHSVDATNWEIGPCKFGRWNAFGGKMSVRGSAQNLRAEVEWYLELERKARERWKKEMVKLEEIAPTGRIAPSVQLSLARVQTDPTGNIVQRTIAALQSPTVRLAHKESGREEGKGLEKKPPSPKGSKNP